MWLEYHEQSANLSVRVLLGVAEQMQHSDGDAWRSPPQRKTMTDAVALYESTTASSFISNCQQHQRASGEPSAKIGGGGCTSVYYAAEEFAWELGLTD